MKKKPKLTDFDKGILVAASVLMAAHNNSCLAADILIETGLSCVDCSEMDDFDKEELRKLQGERGGAIKLKGLGKRRRK